MNLCMLMGKELLFRRRRVINSVVAVAIASLTLISALTLLDLHDRAARALLSERQRETEEAGATLRDEMRKATLKLSFNLLILPAGVDLKQWYVDQESNLTLPGTYGDRLVQSGIVTVRHILPMIQKRLVWPETGRSVVLIGTKGEVAEGFANPRKPLIQPVPQGTIVLGSELHRPLGLTEGQTVEFMGRELTVHRLHEERGSKDDITVWIHLSDAQDLLDMHGRISSLLALECLCAGGEGAINRIRAEVGRALPGTQVVEMGTKVLARAEARIQANAETWRQLEAEKEKQAGLARQRQRLAALLVPVILLLCAGWVFLLSLYDARDRRGEIGMLRAVGLRIRSLLALFLSRAVLIGLAGGLTGYVCAMLLCSALAPGIDGLANDVSVWSLTRLGTALAGAVLFMLMASWIPLFMAAQTDPADVLREE